MSKIVFITGGQRSGKSRFAQSLASLVSPNPVYLATSRAWDDDFRQRIARHQSDRDAHWQTIEEDVHLGRLDLTGRVVVLDCITLWLTNIFHDHGYHMQNSLDFAQAEFEQLIRNNFVLFCVSNEVGMGLHPVTEAGLKFTDLQGFMNQYIARVADEAYLMVSGLPVKLK